MKKTFKDLEPGCIYVNSNKSDVYYGGLFCKLPYLLVDEKLGSDDDINAICIKPPPNIPEDGVPLKQGSLVWDEDTLIVTSCDIGNI